MGASQENKKTDIFAPRAWGLPGSAIKKLGVRLHEFWERYAEYFEPQTRDSSHHALDYWLLRKIAGAGLTYMGDVPTDTQVYREKPVVGLPTKDTNKGGRAFTRPRVLSADKPSEIRQLAADPGTKWQMFANCCELSCPCRN